VELVPYNLLSYSESPVTSPWGTNATLTANAATAPDGTMTATRVQLANGAAQYLYQGVPFLSGAKTISCYIKGTTAQTIGFNDGNAVTNSINITTEWQRYTFTYNTNSGGMGIQFDNYFGVSPSQEAKDFYIWGAQLVEGSTAKDYQKTETRLNIPRLDYSNGTCPSLLVEPQRTNVCRDSNNLSGGSWLNQTTNTTITRIQSGGPDGNAFDRLVVGGASGSNQGRFVQFTTNVGSSAVYSVYVRGTGIGFIGLFNGASSPATSFTLTDEWVRYDTISTSGSGTYIDWAIYVLGGSTCDVAFHQVEFGSYSTSYIPTTSASVTRNEESLSSPSIPSLFGSTEGSFFIELTFDGLNGNGAIPLFLRSSVSNQFNHATYLQFGSSAISLAVYNGGTLQATITGGTFTNGQNLKVGFAYKANDFVLYVNGIQIGTDTSGSISSSLSFIDLGSYLFLQSTFQYNGSIKAAALWQTRLTNTQLAQLTTI
jgi:hypothetical protein